MDWGIGVYSLLRYEGKVKKNGHFLTRSLPYSVMTTRETFEEVKTSYFSCFRVAKIQQPKSIQQA